MSLRVIHLSTYDCIGGASVAAFRLNENLNQHGIHSRMFVREKTKGINEVIRFNPQKNSFLNKAISLYRKKKIHGNYSIYKNIPKDKELFSSPLSAFGKGPLSQLPEADIYHLHWITNFLDIPELFRELKKRAKPVVWTLHDMNPFTGGCHHDDDCGKYMNTCGACPQLGSTKSNDLSGKNYEIKKRSYSLINKNKIWIAADSNWLRDCARQSSLFKDYRIDTVHYGIDTNVFKPIDKNAARKVLGIEDGVYVISFGAANISNVRKGFHFLTNAINLISKDYKNILLLTYGDNIPDYAIKVPVKHLGPVVNLNMMTIIQNAADFFVIPSMREAFGQTCLEAMSCGTPVVGFNGGGIPDMIKDGLTGYLAKEKDVDSLALSLIKMLNDDHQRLEMAKNARQFVLENFTLEIQTEKYLKIYNQLLDKL